MKHILLLSIALSLGFSEKAFSNIYYSWVSTGGGRNVTVLSNWKDGSGINPSNFTSGDEFHIANGDSMSASSQLIISGGGKLVIEANSKFNATGFDHNLTADMHSGSFYYVNSAYNNLVLGAINAASTFYVLYIPSGSLTHLRYDLVYSGNLNLNNLNSSASYVGIGNALVQSLNVGKDLNIRGVSTVDNFNVVKSMALNIGGNLNIISSLFQATYNAFTPTFNITGNLNIMGGVFVGTAYSGSPTINIGGNFNHTGGTFAGVNGSGSGNPQFNIAGNFVQSGGSYNALNGGGTGRVNFNMTGNGTMQAVNLGSANHNVTISGNISLLSNFTIGENLSLTSGSLSIGAYTLTLNKTVTIISGTLTGGNSSNITIGPSSVGLNLPAVTIATLLINRTGQTVTLVGNVIVGTSLNINAGNLSIGSTTLTLNNSLTLNGTLTGGATSNLTIGGTASPALNNLPALTLNNLTLNRNFGAALAGPVTLNGTLLLTIGQLDNSSQVLTLADGASITRDAGSLKVTPAFAGFYNLNYIGSTAVNTANELSATFPSKINNLTVSKTGGLNLTKSFEVNQVVTINSGGVTNANSFSINADGNWINNGTFNAGSGTVNFLGNSTISGVPVGGHSFYNISIGAGSIMTAPSAVNVNISNSFGVSPTSIFNNNNGTVTFNGAGSQTIPSINYFNLTSSGSGSRVLSSSGIIGVAGTFTPGTNSYTTTGSTVDFDGSSAQNIPSFSFNNLNISGGSVKTLNSGDATVNGTLTFNSGKVSTGGNKIIIASTGSVAGAGAAGYVNGNLQKNFSIGTGISRIFEIGDAGNYTPISLTFASVTSAGNIIASTTSGDHAQIASSCIDATESVNRYWTLTNSGVSPANYDAVVNFVSGDIDAGANFNNFQGDLYNGSWQILTAGIRTATSTQFTGVAAFGDIQVGETNAPVSVSISANPGASVCPGTSVTFTATPVNGGASPTYQWTKNGSNVGSNSSAYVDNTLVNGDIVQVSMISNSPCAFSPNNAASSNILTISNPGSCNYSWTGTVSTDWNTAGNWNVNFVPDSTDMATIASGTPFSPVLTSSVKIKDITINASASFTLNAGSTFNIFGNFVNSGTYTDNGGTTVFKGSSSQSITGATTFQNFTISNSAGTTLNNAVTITGALSLLNGTITTNGNLVLNLNAGSIAYNLSDAGNISGNIKVSKSILFSKSHYLGCPVTGTTANDFNDNTQVINPGSGKTRLFTWDCSAQSWGTGIYNLNTALTPMTGYSLFFTAATTLDFTGGYNHGATFSSIDCPNSTANNYVLVGNPYPSTLDWNSVSGWTKTGLNDAIYFWDAQNTRYASYVNGTGSNGGTQYIPSLQAFYVTIDGTGGTATVLPNNLARVGTPNNNLWRIAIPDNTLRIKASSSGYSDETIIKFSDNATKEFDKNFDAFKIKNPEGSPSLYTSDSKNIYSINTMPLEDRIIPLNIDVNFSGSYTLSFEGIESLGSYCSFVLEDKFLNTSQPVNSQTVYTCNINNGDKTDRFNLRVATNSNTTNSNSTVQIGSYENTVNLKFNSTASTASFSIYDLLGQPVTQVNNADITSGSIAYPVSFSEGLYIVKVTVDGNVYAGKIYVK
jgi:hypothetical protein